MVLDAMAVFSPEPSLWDIAGVAAIIAVLIFMLIGKRPFRKSRREVPEHALLVTIPLSDDDFGSPEERERIRGVTGELDRVIKARRVGEFDGDEFGEGKCTLYMYGPDADALFEAVAPVLRSKLPPGSSAVKRYGTADDPDAREVTIPL
jgi:hypothetical protein